MPVSSRSRDRHEAAEARVEAAYERDVDEVMGPQFMAMMRRRMSEYPSWRVGQAFMSCLPDSQYDRLTNTMHDPFYKDSWRAVWDALDYLTRSV